MFSETPVLSVIIPTRDRINDLKRCLDALVSQRCKEISFEVLVIDDHSCQDSLVGYHDIIKAVQNNLNISFFCLPIGEVGAVYARNYGLKHATGKYIGLLDDDSVPEANWVETLVRYFETYPEVMAVTGWINAVDLLHPLSAFRQNMYNQRYERLMSSDSVRAFQKRFEIFSKGFNNGSVYPTDSISGGNSGFRREAVNVVGNLDTRFRMMHDKEYALRLLTRGYICIFAPDLQVRHNHTKSIMDSIFKSYRSGKYHYLLNKLYSTWLKEKVVDIFRPFKILSKSLLLLRHLRFRAVVLIPVIFIMEYLHQIGYFFEVIRNRAWYGPN